MGYMCVGDLNVCFGRRLFVFGAVFYFIYFFLLSQL